MNNELDNALCAKYPKIFVERNLPMNQTCMCWGFDHGDGWYNIIDMLCSNIQHTIDQRIENNERDAKYVAMVRSAQSGDFTLFNEYYHWAAGGDGETLEHYRQEVLKADIDGVESFRHPKEEIPQVVAEQVKEKYGTLRFYYRGGNEEISGMVEMAESMSGVTCEVCGSVGKTRGGGWVRTLCDEHAKSKV
jgi:hypothetical protein